jgi:hypothetical protein
MSRRCRREAALIAHSPLRPIVPKGRATMVEGQSLPHPAGEAAAVGHRARGRYQAAIRQGAIHSGLTVAAGRTPPRLDVSAHRLQ